MTEKLNFLKWQILSRLPHGSIFERIKEGIKHKELTEEDLFYYIYWLDLNRGNLKKYVLGTFQTDNKDYIPFIQFLDQHYGQRNFYEITTSFGTIQISRPKQEDYKCFKAEFLDIVIPYLVDRNLPIPFLEGPYEYHDVSLEKKDVVLDLGANYGLFSSVALAKDCEVYAFEPTIQAKQDYLDLLASKNSNMKVIGKAVSNKIGTSLFEIHRVSSCNKLTKSQNGNTVYVETTTIDEFVHQENLSHVDFIKADIEGEERFMLEGARETIKTFAPKLSLCYYHSIDDLKVLRKMILEMNPNYEIEVAHRKIYAKRKQK